MGQSGLKRELESEQALAEAAGCAASHWQSLGLAPLWIALRGDLGSGKTTWVRAMLRGLGYRGRVPSPTYTLLEHYPIGLLTVAHFDLYRLGGAVDLENLGFRDWIAEPHAWLLIEWPERAGNLADRCDLELEFHILGLTARSVTARARTASGEKALAALSELRFNN